MSRAAIFIPEVICCSAYDESSIAQSLREVGIQHCLSKPPNCLEIKNVLKSVSLSLAEKMKIVGVQVSDEFRNL